MSIRDAAKLAEVSPATLCRVEGEKMPDLDTFARLCKWMGSDPATHLDLRATVPSAVVKTGPSKAINTLDARDRLADMIRAENRRQLLDEG